MIVKYDELFEKKLEAGAEILMEYFLNDVGIVEEARKMARLVLLAAMKIEAENQN